MSLNNAQYDRIMQDYAAIRAGHRKELEERTKEIYARIPSYEKLDNTGPDIALAYVRARSDGKPLTADMIRETFRTSSREKEALLAEAGYPADYLRMRYDCADCQDTGYRDGVRCHCMEQKIRDLLYEQSHLLRLSRENNFSLMRTDFYTGEDLRRFNGAVSTCRLLIDSFPEGPGGILFFGPVGSGKSFLSIATAKEILDKGFSVLYYSAVTLFEQLSLDTFGSAESAGKHTLMRELTESALLVIDDLGTELTNAFVSTQLFHCINERHLLKRATIISTNLDFDELRARYSDRIFSRLMHDYTLCELTGFDIRLRRSMQ